MSKPISSHRSHTRRTEWSYQVTVVNPTSVLQDRRNGLFFQIFAGESAKVTVEATWSTIKTQMGQRFWKGELCERLEQNVSGCIHGHGGRPTDTTDDGFMMTGIQVSIVRREVYFLCDTVIHTGK